MRAKLIGLTAILFLMPGCGGGSSSQTASPTANLHALQPGDDWVYTVTGQSIPPTGASTSFKGTLTLVISTAVLNGASVLALSSTLNVTANGMTSTPLASVVYIQQNASTGDVLELGDNGGGTGAETLTTPQTLFPGAWKNGVAINTTLNSSNGNTQLYALNVTGTSTVSTPIGNFAVWLANAGAGSGVTEAWAPQLGAPVKITLQGGVLGTGSATAILQSTTVPH